MRQHAHVWASALLICTVLTGCQNARQKALSVGLSSLNAARDGFLVYDERRQAGIVASATSLEDGKVKLAEYRSRREPLLQAFVIAYSSLAVAALDDNAERLADAGKAAAVLYDLIKSLMKEAP